MDNQVPEPIAIYYKISNQEKYELIERSFSPEAVVHDEGETHRGLAAIESWLRNAKQKYVYTIEPIEVSRQANKVTVVSTATGNFPGSPAKLKHQFELHEDKICSLSIA